MIFFQCLEMKNVESAVSAFCNCVIKRKQPFSRNFLIVATKHNLNYKTLKIKIS